MLLSNVGIATPSYRTPFLDDDDDSLSLSFDDESAKHKGETVVARPARHDVCAGGGGCPTKVSSSSSSSSPQSKSSSLSFLPHFCHAFYPFWKEEEEDQFLHSLNMIP